MPLFYKNILKNSNMQQSAQWLGKKPEEVKEEKIKLDPQEITSLVDKMMKHNENSLNFCKDAYKLYNNTDLGSIILRFEQNATQFKKIINSLKED